METKSSPTTIHPRWYLCSYWIELYARIAKDDEPQKFKSQSVKKGTQ